VGQVKPCLKSKSGPKNPSKGGAGSLLFFYLPFSSLLSPSLTVPLAASVLAA